MKNRNSIRALIGTLVLLAPTFSRADDAPVDAAREVFEKNQNAVVWVTAVMKMRAGGALGAAFGRQEQKVEAVGTIIHESGLTVLSYTNLDPASLFNSMQGGLGGEKIEFKTELSGVKIRLGDGTEVPAKLVLKDEDLDLAFVMPTDPGKKLPFLKLDATGEPPQVKPLDPLIVLGRLGQALDRQPSVGIIRVSAVVNKPRTFYVCGDMESLGTPAFAADKRPLGIIVMRKQAMEGGGGLGMMMSSGSGGLAAVVVPTADVMEVAQQALAKKDEPAPEPAKEEPSTENPPSEKPAKAARK